MNTVIQSDEFSAWLKSLKDQTARAKVIVRIRRLMAGNMGSAKHFDGLTELRIAHGPGYRIYMVKEGATIYLLLIGGDKSSQKQDLARAKSILAQR